MRILVTGGAGFIGSNLVRHLLSEGHHVANVDKLTYAANPDIRQLFPDSDAYHLRPLDMDAAKGYEQHLLEGAKMKITLAGA